MPGIMLERRLSAVAARLHRLRILRRQTVCWLIVLLPAIVLCLMLPTSGLPLRRESLALIAACIGGLILARWRMSVPTWLETARLVEQHDPELNDVVLTAIRQQSHDSHVSPVLAARVLREADNMALVADWRTVASGRQIFKWFAGSLMTFALLVSSVFTAGRLAESSPAQESVAAADSVNANRETRVAVEPGDVELERGTSLTVVARFIGSLPSHAAVEFRPDDSVDSSTAENAAVDAGISTHAMDPTVDAGVFAVRLPAISQNGSYTVVFGNDDAVPENELHKSDAYRVTTYVRPRVVQVDAEIAPPEWSGRNPSVVEDTLRIVAIEGSQVTLRLYLNKPVAESLLLKQRMDRFERSESATPGVQQQIPLTTAEAQTLQATAVAQQDESWTVSLRDEQGRTASEETRITLRIIRNEPPAIRITFPRPDISVSALQEVVTEAEATDDFGIVDYGIAYSLSGGESYSLSLRTENESAADRVAMDHTIVLETLNAAPNDLLTWHFYADTYGSDGEIHRSLSDLMFADVRRFEEIFRESQQQGGQSQQQQQGRSPTDNLLQIQRQIAIAIWNVQRSLSGSTRQPRTAAAENIETILESQQVALEQLIAIKERADDTREMADAVAAAQSHMNDVVDALTSWSADTPEPALTEGSVSAQAAFQQLLRLRAAEHDVSQSRSQQGRGSGQNSAMQQQLNQLELDNDRNRYETEREAQQDQQTEKQREHIQILNRLKGLARRQNLLNERLKQLESELRNAQTEEERESIERDLKRLRDEQREMLRDVDELRERMDQSTSRNTSQQQQMRQQVDQARSNVREASRAMDEGRLSEALSEGTRAERQFDQLQEQFRNQTSLAFSEAARDLRQQTRELSERQQDIARQLAGEDSRNEEPERQDDPPSLRSSRNTDEIQEQLGQQRDDLNRILEQSRQLVEQAENSEPLLTRRLYETVRRVKEMKPDKALQAAEFLAGRGLWQQVAEPEEAARRGIETLREGVEEAAEAILGSEVESLRRARSTLEQLSEELSEELSAATGTQPPNPDPQSESGQPDRSGREGRSPEDAESELWRTPRTRSEQNQPQNDQAAEQQSPTNEAQQNNSGNSASQSDSRQPSDNQQSGGRQSGSNQRESSSSGQQQRGGREQESDLQSGPQRRSVLLGGGRESGGSSSIMHRPLTGSNFRDWSDRLREVEEMLEDIELRNRVARVRDRARSMRAEFRRHGTEPQWDLVESDLLDEMQSLQRRLAQEIAAMQSDHSMVPIDREPVPEEFDELVQRYYELLGQERQEPAP